MPVVTEDYGEIKNCVMCTKPCLGNNLEDKQLFGKIIKFQLDGKNVEAHMFCIYAAPQSVQQDEKIEGERKEEIPYINFTLESIKLEILRGRRLKCKFCRRRGAIHGCLSEKCNAGYHFSCGRKNGILFLGRGEFTTFCPKHVIKAEEMDEPWALSVQLRKEPSETSDCSICYEKFENEFAIDILNPFCCKTQFVHRRCLQGYANVVGRYKIRCPFCKNHRTFKGWCHASGILMEKKLSDVEVAARAAEDELDNQELVCELCEERDERDVFNCYNCGRVVHMACGTVVDNVICCVVCSRAETQAASNAQDTVN